VKSTVYLKKLRDDVDRWVAKGLIDLTVGDALISDAATHHGADDRPGTALPGLAGLAILLGILTLIGANWAGLTGVTRLAIVAALLAAMFGLGGELFARRLHPWGDIATLLGAALFGGGIIVIGQLYHANETTSAFLAVWAVAASGVALLFPATLTGIFACLLTLFWTIAHIDELGESTGPYWAVALLAGLAFRARLARSISLVNFLAFTAIVWASVNLLPLLETLIPYGPTQQLAFVCSWIGLAIIAELIVAAVPFWAGRTISAWLFWMATASFVGEVLLRYGASKTVSQMEMALLGLVLFSMLTAYGALPGRGWLRIAGIVGFVACAIVLFTLIKNMIFAGLALIGFGCALIIVVLISNRVLKSSSAAWIEGRTTS